MLLNKPIIFLMIKFIFLFLFQFIFIKTFNETNLKDHLINLKTFYGKSSNIQAVMDAEQLGITQNQMLIQANSNLQIQTLDFSLTYAPTTGISTDFNVNWALVLIRNQHVEDPNYYILNTDVYNPQSFDENNNIYKPAINNVIIYQNKVLNANTFYMIKKNYKIAYPMPITLKTNDIITFLWTVYPSPTSDFSKVKSQFIKEIDNEGKEMNLTKKVTPIGYFTGHVSYLEKYTITDYIDTITLSKKYAA